MAENVTRFIHVNHVYCFIKTCKFRVNFKFQKYSCCCCRCCGTCFCCFCCCCCCCCCLLLLLGGGGRYGSGSVKHAVQSFFPLNLIMIKISHFKKLDHVLKLFVCSKCIHKIIIMSIFNIDFETAGGQACIEIMEINISPLNELQRTNFKQVRR